eukprot:2929597-Pleurochrysis_carterae.AAC.1
MVSLPVRVPICHACLITQETASDGGHAGAVSSSFGAPARLSADAIGAAQVKEEEPSPKKPECQSS